MSPLATALGVLIAATAMTASGSRLYRRRELTDQMARKSRAGDFAILFGGALAIILLLVPGMRGFPLLAVVCVLAVPALVLLYRSWPDS